MSDYDNSERLVTTAERQARKQALRALSRKESLPAVTAYRQTGLLLESMGGNRADTEGYSTPEEQVFYRYRSRGK
jgi:hypothetical protein